MYFMSSTQKLSLLHSAVTQMPTSFSGQSDSTSNNKVTMEWTYLKKSVIIDNFISLHEKNFFPFLLSPC